MAESYTERLHRHAVSLVVDQGMSLREAAKRLDVTVRSLRIWLDTHQERTRQSSEPSVLPTEPRKVSETKVAPDSPGPVPAPGVQASSPAPATFVPVIIETEEESRRSIPIRITLPNRWTMHLKLASIREVAELLHSLEIPSC